MLDGIMRRLVDGPLDRAGARLAAAGVGADALTAAGLVVGLGAAAAIAAGATLLGLVLVLASRLADGLDGAVARATRKTDLGGFLDIVCDFVFYGAVPLAFAALDPARNALPAAFLLVTFYVNGASFLGYAILAAKHGMETRARGSKSLYFTTGLAEGTETIAVFLAACLWPAAFPALAVGFGLLCLLTTAARVRLAMTTFRS
ncbi:CDP-alcohol phosphatidyltransferase family protein [Prosthecomicrobium sp. N25]|uniref:CDP-alcohol phosphatidyltransferase family protein n=1 Tax=Prosthecomicrobium sp. N25 TaxID=3129254 RepID=UPI003077519C